MTKGTILVTGGTGKISTRLIPLLSSAGCTSLVASRSGVCPSLPNTTGVKFDWFDPSTYTSLLSGHPVKAIFLVSPPVENCLPSMKPLIDLAVQSGVRRFVLLSGSLLSVGDGPMMSAVSSYIISLGVEFAILRPSWFMENFSEMEHQKSIRDHDKIFSAAGDGKVPFIAAEDIAAIAFRALTDEVPHNTDHLILGPDLLSYDDVAALLTQKLGRTITHIRISEDDLALAMEGFGVPKDYARILAQLDTAIKNGEEDRMNDVVLQVTGRPPRRFESFVDEYVGKGVWSRE